MTYDNGLFEPTFVMTFQVEFCLSIIKNDIIDSYRSLCFEELLKLKDSNEAIQLKRCGLCQYNKNMKKEKRKKFLQ